MSRFETPESTKLLPDAIERLAETGIKRFNILPGQDLGPIITHLGGARCRRTRIPPARRARHVVRAATARASLSRRSPYADRASDRSYAAACPRRQIQGTRPAADRQAL